MSVHGPDKSDPHRTCTVHVEGVNAAHLVDAAIKMAAMFLNESAENLFASHVGSATVLQRSKFRPHLGVQGHPIRWQATITVKLDPDLVRDRRSGRDLGRDRKFRVVTRGD